MVVRLALIVLKLNSATPPINAINAIRHPASAPIFLPIDIWEFIYSPFLSFGASESKPRSSWPLNT